MESRYGSIRKERMTCGIEVSEMIKIENADANGFEAAIRGMRNPMNSWDKSDSGYDYLTDRFEVGENDFKLMKQLVKAGSDHSKFMRMINVTCDVIAPLYWWKEFDTYKVGTVRNSCSTMHKIHAKEFTLDDFSHDRLLVIEKLETVIARLNEYRDLYVNWDNKKSYVDSNGVELERKDIWWQLIQLLPSSFNQRATVAMNYQVLRNIYHSRKNHRLDEWRAFCEWIETLPWSEIITMEE